MKKLLALLLALVCVLSIASCGIKNNNNNNGDNPSNKELLELYAGYLSVSIPTKSEVTTTVTEGNNVLISTNTLTTGSITDNSGSKAATTLVTKAQTFNSIETGMLNLVDEKVTEEWYLEGKGVSTNKGRSWKDGTNFAASAGSLQLGLSEENFTSITYDKDKGELVLVCSADTAASVIGYYLPGDYDHYYETTVTISAFGDKITGIKISYAIEDRPAGDEDDPDASIYVDYTTVEVNAVYEYGLQTINLNGYKG